MSCYFAGSSSLVCCVAFGDVLNLPPTDFPPLDSATTLYHRYELDVISNMVIFTYYKTKTVMLADLRETSGVVLVDEG